MPLVEILMMKKIKVAMCVKKASKLKVQVAPLATINSNKPSLKRQIVTFVDIRVARAVPTKDFRTRRH